MSMLNDWGTLGPNYDSPMPVIKKVMLPNVHVDDEQKRQDDAFKRIIQQLAEDKEKAENEKRRQLIEERKPVVIDAVTVVFEALGVTTLPEALERIKELQWEIDRLNTMLADAYNDALSGNQ